MCLLEKMILKTMFNVWQKKIGLNKYLSYTTQAIVKNTFSRQNKQWKLYVLKLR